MIIDNRTGSDDLASLLRRRGVEADLGRLPYGDASFVGEGPEGMPVSIGVEVKTVTDVLACIIDGRFAGHQLPGLVQAYNYPFLLIEGKFRPDRISGMLQIMGHKGYWHVPHLGQRSFMYKELDAWLFTMEFRGGCRVVRTYDRPETVQYLADLYHWWTDKAFEQHRSHLALQSEPDKALLVRPSIVRRFAAELPGIGWEKSAAVSSHFATPADLILASEEEWRTIPGIGKVLAQRIIEALNG